MPQNIPGNAGTFAPAIRAPTDSDAANTSQLTVAFSDIADRTANLKSRLDTLLPGTGSLNLRRVATLGALAQLTPHADGDLCFVDRVGLYQWSATSVVTSLNLGSWVQAANDTPGAGRWLLLPALVGAPFGIPILDSAARLGPGIAHNSTFDLAAANSGGTPGTTLLGVTSSTDVDLPGTLVTFTEVPAGSLVVVMASVMCNVVTGAVGRASIVIDDGGPKSIQQINIEALSNQATNGYALTGIYKLLTTVTGNGQLNIRLRGARVTGTTNVTFMHQCALTALLVSP